VTFKFAGARAVVCGYCKFVVARTDRGLTATGRMADLLEIPTPLVLHATGRWGGEPFEVEGRVQMDRAGAPGAPWQEIVIGFPMKGTSSWVAYAQGRWYTTSEAALPPQGAPAVASLAPGRNVDLGPHGHWVVQEIGQRRVVSGEGSLPNVPAPGAVTRYADISAAGGRFGTIDYGDGSAAPVLFLGRQFDPRELTLDSGAPIEAPEAKAAAVECPNCGGNLPLMSQQAERIVCQYCGTASDVTRGTLSALGPSPRPPIQPAIAMGTSAEVRGARYIVCGFVIRSCRVEGETYSWREYLLFGGENVGYRWLMEEDGRWSFVDPVETGDVMDSGGHMAAWRGAQYGLKQQVQARVDYVIGEFYWKVEIGETVTAAEFEGPGGKLSRERSQTEVNYSFVSPMAPAELAAFGIAAPSMPMFTGSSSSGGGASKLLSTIIILIIICIVISVVMGGACGGTSGGGYGGSGWSK
jgi:hypothetical protein